MFGRRIRSKLGLNVDQEVGHSLLRRNCKHLALLPERVSPGVFRDEHPKRELTPETAVTKPGLQGSLVSREGSQENTDPGDLGSVGQETQGKESFSLQSRILPVVTRSGRISKPNRRRDFVYDD